jgi:hypothetical protein
MSETGSNEMLRRFVAAGLCDLVNYLSTLREPIIIGGQYNRDLLIKVFQQWCQGRNINVTDPNVKAWLLACQQGRLITEEGATKPPPNNSEPPLVIDEPCDNKDCDTCDSCQKDFYTGDDWKDPKDKKDNWTEEGEDWKGTKDNDQNDNVSED